jgi:YfiH family protein
MILKKRNHIPFFQFPNLAEFPHITHGIFTRNSGCSKGRFKSLNVGFDIGDDPIAVKRNRRIVLQTAQLDDLVYAKQVHRTDVLVFSNDDKAINKPDPQSPARGDALVTNIPKKLLFIQVADCQPILLYDPLKKVVANIHSGWRGSIRNIIGRTIDVMYQSFGCASKNIFAAIGPSLGPCCAEFTNYKKEIPELFWDFKTGLNHFDFRLISKDQLNKAGVHSENIFISGICTSCNTDKFYSYRKEGTTGRFAAVIGLT